MPLASSIAGARFVSADAGRAGPKTTTEGRTGLSIKIAAASNARLAQAANTLGLNAMRLMLHPRGFRPHIVNWEAMAAALIQWLHRDVLSGLGDGTFTVRDRIAVGPLPSQPVVGDFDGDEIADLAVAVENGDAVALLLGRGDGTFAPSAPSLPTTPTCRARCASTNR